ncbi:citrate transporter, partial [Enterococcus faecium]|nr:citrate transporter [Enterococcus faecium]MCZ1227393.1 citrate transporter [Enterococcus faecium]
KNIVLLTEINGFFDASLLHNYMDVISSIGVNLRLFINIPSKSIGYSKNMIK